MAVTYFIVIMVMIMIMIIVVVVIIIINNNSAQYQNNIVQFPLKDIPKYLLNHMIPCYFLRQIPLNHHLNPIKKDLVCYPLVN